MRNIVVCSLICATATLCLAVEASEPAPAKSGVAFVVPELPRHRVDTTMPAQSGKSVRVAAGGDLQKAIDDAVGGDTLIVEAGATFVGTFSLPKKSGNDWIVIMSSATDQLPSPGTRVTPADASWMPRIVTATGDQPALRAAPAPIITASSASSLPPRRK